MLLDRHVGAHGRRRELDDLDGLLAHDVRDKDEARGAGDDELARAFRRSFPPLFSRRLTLSMPVRIPIPRRPNAPATPRKTASPSPPRIRGATSSSRTREPNAANTKASWHPVASVPTTTEVGRRLIAQTSLWVMACSLPGNPILLEGHLEAES